MIPSSIAESTIQALDGLAEKGPPNNIAQAVERVKKVVDNNTAEEGAFSPIDFTESDLSEAIKVFEAAARKDLDGSDTEARSAHATFRGGMNQARDADDRTKCRTTLIVDLAAAIAKKL